MVPSLDTHILTVDANAIHKIDTANPESLFYIWSVFSRCAPSVEQGRRLENLSWRLWQRKTLTSSPSNTSLTSATSSPKDIPVDSRISDLPQLSGSVESAVDEEAVEFASDSTMDYKLRIRREDSCIPEVAQQPVKQDEFEKMVVSIITEKRPLTAPLPQIPSTTSTASKIADTPIISVPRTEKNTTMSPDPIAMPPAPPTAYIPSESIASPTSGSTTAQTTPEDAATTPSVTLNNRPTTIIRGFSPSTASIPRMNLPVIKQPNDNAEPRSITLRNPPRKSAMFTCGGSASSSETGHSLSEQAPKPMPKSAIKKHGMFQVGGSSAESSFKSGLAPPSLSKQKKQTSFSAVVDTISSSNENAIASDSESDEDEDAIETDDDDDDEVDEDAIDDEDSDDWEDSYEESGKSSVDERNFFARVDSKVNLPSRRSLITLMFNDTDGNKKLGGGVASQSTSALHPRIRTHNGPMAAGPSNLSNLHRPQIQTANTDSSEEGLMMKRNSSNGAPLRPIREIPRTAAQPIMAPGALSPRTTRRNMLATELTESLRRHMLWERQQKSKTMNAVLQRRHTSHDVANLKQYPQAPYMNKNAADDDKANWNRYFTKEAADGYHTKGW